MKAHEAINSLIPPASKSSLKRGPSPLLQRSATNAAPIGPVPSIVHDVLQSPGQPLDTGTRSFMESRFGSDLSGVRVHTGDQAAQSARAVNALAYTVGQDIVFGQNQYAPHTDFGQRLLAHELTHTVQQGGLQRYAANNNVVLEQHDTSEREAEQTAAAIVTGSAGPARVRLPDFYLQRTPWGTCPTGRVVSGQPENINLSAELFIVGQYLQAKGRPNTIATNNQPPEEMPGTPATQEMINATVEHFRTGGGRRPGRAGRPPGGGVLPRRTSPVEPSALEEGRLEGRTGPAEVAPPLRPDIIDFVEHTVYDVTTLGMAANKIVTLAQYVELLEDIRLTEGIAGPPWRAGRNFPAPSSLNHVITNPPLTICFGTTDFAVFPGVLAYQPIDISQPPAAPTATPTGTATPPANAEPYTIQALGQTLNFMVAPAPGITNLTTSGPQNLAAAESLPGMSLIILRRSSSPSTPDEIEASIESADYIKSTIPAGRQWQFRDRRQATLHFVARSDESGTRHLELRGRPVAGFRYPLLSEGSVRLNYSEADGLSGTGTLTPSIPLINRAPMQFEFGRDRMRVFYGTRPGGIRLLPGVRLTEASLGVELLPALRPSGQLAFAVGSTTQPFLTGNLEASADASGLVFQGTLNARIPNTDVAQGNVAYRNGQWSGFVVVESSQIRFPGVQRGQVRIDFNPDGSIAAGGQVDLLVADNPVTLSARLARGNLTFRGEGTFRLPGLDPLTAMVETDGSSVNFQGRTGFTIRALSGTMLVRYRNRRWSGEGQAQLNRGRAQGTITVRLSEAGRISGDGSIQYRFTENLTGRVGVLLREDRTIRLSGELRFETIQLFRAISDRRRLYRFPRISIPILGIALGPVDLGLVARIDADIGIHYDIGPGVLRNTRIAAAIDLLSDNPNLEFEAGTELAIPIGGGFYLTVEGSIALSAGVASISGGVSVTGDAGIRGAFTANALLQYRASQWRLRAAAELLVHPELILTIDARARAEAGVGPFTVEAVRTWNLARFSWGSDMNFGLRFPFEYVSGQEFRFPSFDQIEWVYPREIDFGRMLRRVIN